MGYMGLFIAFNMENYGKTEPTEANLYYVIFEKNCPTWLNFR